MFYFDVIYFASSILTKLAMAVMILRLSSTRFYAYIIWGNVAVLGTNGLIESSAWSSCLQMPSRRKISLQVILGLGIISSAAGLVRMGYYRAYDTKAHPHESFCKQLSNRLYFHRRNIR
ncbi:hypothetical protein CSHISOI_01292 [Colletotrichum shisoi]|uniref:Uncharacterized protein n=1 Tax=Colletotrichum shisoi TaxID=2078593 RepID=A0A5Q4C472_9PEZI|nr:hypothetical protein CSHISOI_01292 [Colletotrichum shisoi]